MTFFSDPLNPNRNPGPCDPLAWFPFKNPGACPMPVTFKLHNVLYLDGGWRLDGWQAADHGDEGATSAFVCASTSASVTASSCCASLHVLPVCGLWLKWYFQTMSNSVWLMGLWVVRNVCYYLINLVGHTFWHRTMASTHTRLLSGVRVRPGRVRLFYANPWPLGSSAFSSNDKWVKNLRLMTQICWFQPINFMHK